MRLLSLAILVVGCREQKATPTAQPVDGGVDTLAAAIADLEDVGDVTIYPHDVAIVTVKVEPATALTDTKETLTKERWRFRACAKHITQPTETSVTVRVGEGGEIISSTAEAAGELGRCLTDGAQKMKFSEPAGGHASLEIALKYALR